VQPDARGSAERRALIDPRLPYFDEGLQATYNSIVGPVQNGVWLKNGISITAIGIQAAMDAGDIRNGYNEISRKAARDHGLRISQLVNTDRKGGAFPIMLQQFRRAIGVAIVRGNARHKLSRLHYVRTTPEEAAATCRANHSDNRWQQHQHRNCINLFQV